MNFRFVFFLLIFFVTNVVNARVDFTVGTSVDYLTHSQKQNDSFTDDLYGSPSTSFSKTKKKQALQGGVFLGTRFFIQNWFIGPEFTLFYSEIRTETPQQNLPQNLANLPQTTVSSKTFYKSRWGATLRFGYNFSGWLPYGIFGVQAYTISHEMNFVMPNLDAAGHSIIETENRKLSFKKTAFIWGAGIEKEVSPHMLLGVECKVMSLPQKSLDTQKFSYTYDPFGHVGLTPSSNSIKSSLKSQIVTVGLRFSYVI